MPPTRLARLVTAIQADPGLRGSVSAADIREGVRAAQLLNQVLLSMIDQTRANADRLITPADMQAVSDALWLRRNAADWRDFWVGHGNDNGEVESGYHAVQNDGGTLQFQGRNFLDTVADAIYHYGFRTEGGTYFNEDGNTNETLADVAGWLNFFLNGRTAVFGTAGDDLLGSGDYSAALAAGRHETFRAGGGNDEVWAGLGNDRVLAGRGHDVVGGAEGWDRLYGEAGNDTLYGDQGADRLFGGAGDDVLGGGSGDDRLTGGAGRDTVQGDDGRDRLAGGSEADLLTGGAGADRLRGEDGHDTLSGGDGNDRLAGGRGRDEVHGGNGADVLAGNGGADRFLLWQEDAARDTLVFAPGDSGRSPGEIDRVEGFRSGEDRIDLTAFGAMRLAGLDYLGGGRASAYYDGTWLRIDGNGDGATDMMVEFAWVDSLRASDFLFG
jgi:Ca2+-binding RTX toxin-like protein